jgi:hypothetical protein
LAIVPEVKPPELVVIPVPSDGNEQFVVIDTRSMLPSFRLWSSESSSREDWLAACQRHLDAMPRLSEQDVRAILAEKGMSQDAIDTGLERARRFTTLAASAPPGPPFEHITRVGYRNRDGQQVLCKTDRRGPDNQRVFLMRCTVCGHEYGAYGCDADIRRCPACQDGPRGIQV